MIIIDSEIFKVVSIERNHTITIIIIIIFTMIIIMLILLTQLQNSYFCYFIILNYYFYSYCKNKKQISHLFLRLDNHILNIK
jgi:hypothetical protein